MAFEGAHSSWMEQEEEEEEKVNWPPVAPIAQWARWASGRLESEFGARTRLIGAPDAR